MNKYKILLNNYQRKKVIEAGWDIDDLSGMKLLMKRYLETVYKITNWHFHNDFIEILEIFRKNFKPNEEYYLNLQQARENAKKQRILNSK
jgi:hypothetical protein